MSKQDLPASLVGKSSQTIFRFYGYESNIKFDAASLVTRINNNITMFASEITMQIRIKSEITHRNMILRETLKKKERTRDARA